MKEMYVFQQPSGKGHVFHQLLKKRRKKKKREKVDFITLRSVVGVSFEIFIK